MAGRHSKSKRLQEAFLATYRGMGVIGHACSALKIPRSTLQSWIAREPEFKAALELAEEDAIDRLEAEALRRAYEGSDVLLIFLLKGARPNKYRDRWQGELTGQGAGPLVIEIRQFKDDEEDANAVD
jgi:hypothetical protein